MILYHGGWPFIVDRIISSAGETLCAFGNEKLRRQSLGLCGVERRTSNSRLLAGLVKRELEKSWLISRASIASRRETSFTNRRKVHPMVRFVLPQQILPPLKRVVHK